MKKFLSILFSAILLLSMMPIAAMAAENTSDYDKIIAMACDAFPEYADSITGKTSSAYNRVRTFSTNEITFSETRAISGTEYITLTQYAGGGNILIYEDSDITISAPSSDATTDGTDLVITASFQVATSGVSGVFYLNNTEFIKRQNGTGYFNSYGTPSTGGGASYNTSNVVNNTTKISYNITLCKSPFIGDTFTVYYSGGMLHARMGAF